MSGWSRSRSQSRLSSWGQAQDLMTLSNELDQRRKELRLERKPSRSLDPHYIAQRQAQRARSREAQARLSTMGILTPSLLPNPNPNPNPNTQTQTQPTPSSNPTPIRSSSTPHALDPKLQAQAHEILQLRTQLNQLRSERDELKDRLKASNQKSSSDLQSFEIERRLMIQLIKNLKAEVEEGWNRVIRLRETYQGLVVSLYIPALMTTSLNPFPDTFACFLLGGGDTLLCPRSCSFNQLHPTPNIHSHGLVTQPDIPSSLSKP